MSKSIELRAAPDAIGQFCQRRRIRRLTRLDKPVRPGSAAAFLVEFLPADIPPLSELAAMENEIAGILEQPVDLHLHIRGFCTGDISPHGKIAYDRAHYMEFDIPKDKIANFCLCYNITRLASLKYPRRSSIINDADVDFIAEFAPDAKLGLAYFGLGDELTKLLGYPAAVHKVDSIAAWAQNANGQSATVQYERIN